jgi:hypothetical protein
MSKLVLNNIVSGYASSTAYNVNNALIETALENTLSRDGTTPNQMEADFDLNGNDILNGGIINATDIVIAGDSLAGAASIATTAAASALASENAAAISETNSAVSAATAAAYASNIVNWDFKGAWLTATAYLVDNIVTQAGSSYICVVSHTSGTFATDLTAVKWVLFASKGAAGAGAGDLLAANNLSELVGTAATARSNIGAAASGPLASSGITGAAAAGALASSGITGAAASGANSDITSLSNPTMIGYVEAVVTVGVVGASHTLSLASGTVQTATLTSATPCTFTMPTATTGKSFILLLKQPASGSATTATFTGVKWGTAGAPTITATVGKMDILSFVADGTNWYGSIVQGYTP